MDHQTNRLDAFLLLAILWAGIYLPSLGTLELKGEEGRRVLPAVTMIESGNWLTPYVGGEPYYRKPPFVQWAVGATFQLTGIINEWTARLPSVLAIFAFIIVLAWQPGKWLSPTARLLAGILFLTNISLMEKGRLIELEALYICLTGIATLWWLNAWSCARRGLYLWGVPAMVLGLSLLHKGPLSLLFFYLPVIAVLQRHGKLRELLEWRHLASLLLMTGIFLAWAIPAARESSAGQMTSTFGSAMWSRLNPANLQIGKWLFNILRAFTNYLPWLLLLPFLWLRPWVNALPKENKKLFLGARLGLAAAFVLVVCLPGSIPRYSLPAFPLLSLLLGHLLSYRGLPKPFLDCWRNMLWTLHLLLAAATGAALYFSGFTLARSALFVFLLLLTVHQWKGRNTLTTARPLLLSSGLLMVLITCFYTLHIVPFRQTREKRRPAAQAINHLIPKDAPLYLYRPGYQAFIFYLKPPIRYLLSPDQLPKDETYLLLKQTDLEQLTSGPLGNRRYHTLHRLSPRIGGDFRLISIDRAPFR